MSTPTRRHEGRYTFGKRDKLTGRTPVHVDGAEEPTGYVWSTGHGAEPWTAEVGADGAESHPDFKATRWQMAERLVDLVDARAARKAERERDRARGERIPEGWRVASWEEIVRKGYRTVRPVHLSAPVDDHDRAPDKGPRYVIAWRSEPMRIRTVSRHSRIPQHQATYGDFLQISYEGSTFGHSVDGTHTINLGALVPVDAVSERGADPDPVFNPGDLVAYDVRADDGVTDTFYGTVREWTAYLDGPSPYEGGAFRNVRVAFEPGSGRSNCAPSALRRIDALPAAATETVGGLGVGMKVSHFRYHGDAGHAYESTGSVVGFGTCRATGVRLVRFSGWGRSGAYPAAELHTPGSDSKWQAERPRPVADTERCAECGREVGAWDGKRSAGCSPERWAYCYRTLDRPLSSVTWTDGRPWMPYPKTYTTRLMRPQLAQERAQELSANGNKDVSVNAA